MRNSTPPKPFDIIDQDSPLDLAKLGRILLKYKWVIIATTVIIPILLTFYAIKLPKSYRATATMEYDPNPSRPLGGKIEKVADPIGDYWLTQEWYATQNRVIASFAVAEIVANKLELHRNADFLQVPEGRDISGYTVEDAAVMLQGMISVNQQEETRLVYVSITNSNPEWAKVLANAVVEAYIEKLERDRNGTILNALGWLSSQLDDLKNELENSELALHKFKSEHNALSVSLEDRQNLISRDIQRFNEALTNTQLERIELSSKLEGLRKANREDPTTVNNRWIDEDRTIVKLQQEYNSRLADSEELAIRYGEEHPEIKAANATLAALKKQLSRKINGLIKSAEADHREVKLREAKLKKALDKVSQAGMELNRDEIEYRKLAREQDNKEDIYELLLQRTTETDLMRLLSVTNVKLVGRALMPGSPVSPKIQKYTLLGILMGFCLGIVVVFIITQLDNSIRSPEQIEATGLLILGILPAMDIKSSLAIAKNGGLRKERKSRKRRKYSPDRDLIVHTRPMSSVAECCRGIRTNLMFMSTKQPLKTLMVTSPSPYEGKTTVAISLAITMAQSGKRVLLVDSDLRRPRIHRSFERSSEMGVTSILVKGSSLGESVQQTDIEGLDILAAGPIQPNPSELLQTGEFAQMIEQANSRYDWVIFDSPPLGSVTDASVIGSQVTGAILVVQGEATTRDRFRSSVKQLKGVGANLLGAVYNGADLTDSKYGHGKGGYYYYGGYDSNPEAEEGTGTDTPRITHGSA